MRNAGCYRYAATGLYDEGGERIGSYRRESGIARIGSTVLQDADLSRRDWGSADVHMFIHAGLRCFTTHAEAPWNGYWCGYVELPAELAAAPSEVFNGCLEGRVDLVLVDGRWFSDGMLLGFDMARSRDLVDLGDGTVVNLSTEAAAANDTRKLAEDVAALHDLMRFGGDGRG